MLVFVAVALLYVPFARLGVDAHHDGVMLYPALRVAEGAVVHGDVFNMYGPVSSWVQALWVLLLGPTLWAIRVGTALMLAAGLATFHLAWRRMFGQGVALTATVVAVLLTPFLSPDQPMYPWSSDVVVLLIGIVAFLLSRPRADEAHPVPWATVGVLTSAVALTRAVPGIVLAMLLAVWLASAREWRRLQRFILGAALFSGVSLCYLGFNDALGDWWYQTFEVARSWLSDHPVPRYGSSFIKEALLDTAAPALLIVLVAITALGGRFEESAKVSRRRLLRAALLVAGLLFAVVYHDGWLNPGVVRWNVLWATPLLVATAGPWLSGWFDVNRPAECSEKAPRFWVWASTSGMPFERWK